MSDHITVCICTYRRAPMLARLLRSLETQETGGQFTFSAVVVDNDAAGSAGPDVERLRRELRLEIVYDIEPERTIPAARNHALRLAQGTYIGIVDDDEVPAPRWLVNLYEAIGRYDADGALGPILPLFEDTPPAWLVRSGLCVLPSWKTGTLLRWNQTRTGNVLLKKDVFDRNGLRFDETYRTGGSDQAFFREAMARGFRFIAVEEAPVHEIVPPERWKKGYWIRRALVNGFNAQKYLARGGHPLRILAASIKSAGALAVYGIGAPVCACLGPHVLMKCAEKGSYHLSRLAAMIGIELWKKRDF